MDSIICKTKRCYICGTTNNIHCHHIFFGPKRKWAEKYGLKVYLCQSHHEGNYSPHHDRILDLGLKKLAQTMFEADVGNREEFRQIFGKSYL